MGVAIGAELRCEGCRDHFHQARGGTQIGEEIGQRAHPCAGEEVDLEDCFLERSFQRRPEVVRVEYQPKGCGFCLN